MEVTKIKYDIIISEDLKNLKNQSIELSDDIIKMVNDNFWKLLDDNMDEYIKKGIR
jgi:hypothetical protein